MKTIKKTDDDFICDINAPCFQMLSQEETELVKASKTQVFFRKGDNLTKQGAFASYVLFIVTGLAKQYVEDDTMRSFNLRISKPGDFIALPAVFNKNTFSYTTVALTDCRAFLIEKETIADLVRSNGDFGFNIIKRFFRQHGDLYDTLRRAMFKQMNRRMTDTLLYLKKMKNEFPDIFHLLSRKDIADFTGITPESAIKLLKQFEKDGLILLNEKDIVLLKLNELKELSLKG